MPPIDIVIPIHGGLPALRRCIQSVHAAQCRTPYELVLIDDASADPAIEVFLREFEVAGRATVIRLPTRQGVAAAINRGIGLHRDRDVVVLQSDAEVANDWLDRLLHHATRGVGVIGTFTNNAGVATYPMPRHANALPAGQSVASLDALFARGSAGASVALPSVDGPCLLFRRDCLNAVGSLDGTPLGSDYGIEIDFCLRAGSAGFRHLLAGDVFVGHAGHGSFGALKAEGLADRTEQALANLYPMYLAQKKEVLEREPARPFARRVDLLRLAQSDKRMLVYVSHPWGGGIRRYMHDVAALASSRCDVLYLEPAVGSTVKLSWPQAGENFALYFTLPDELPLLAETLRTIGVDRLHFHHVHMQPQAILALPAVAGIPFDCTLHDYYAICPQYHLVTEDGRYCGEPGPAGCAACLAKRPGQWGLDITDWRAAFGRLLRDADRVIAPSADVSARIRRYFPDVTVDVWPHPEESPPPPTRVVRVAILGNLSPEKGLHVVAECARDARIRNLPLTFRVLGSTTEPVPQAPDVPLTIYGQYFDSELARLIAAERPDVLLFAAQVPETYAYTMSIALQSGLPIVASALGAFPERLQGVPKSTIVPWDAPPAVWNDALIAASGVVERSRRTIGGAVSRSPTG